MLLIGVGVLVVSFFLLGAARALVGLIAASLLTGVGFGRLDANCNAVMVDLHHDKSAKYLGMLHGGFGVGGLIAPLLIGALLAIVSWHTVRLSNECADRAGGSCVHPSALSAREKACPNRQRSSRSRSAGSKRFYFRRKNVLMLLATMLYCAVSQAGFLIWIVRYMTLQYHAEALGLRRALASIGCLARSAASSRRG